MISFVMPGDPVAKARPRFARNGSKVVTFTPPKTKAYENDLAYAARIALEGQGMTLDPVSVTVEVVLAVPRSWTKAKRKQALDGVKTPGKPDIDNYIKIVLDGLNGIVWHDDSQVVSLWASKRYGVEPYMRVKVEA